MLKAERLGCKRGGITLDAIPPLHEIG